MFFAHLNPFSVFFSHSTKRVSCLDECVAIRIPRSVQTTRWNFESRIVSTLSEDKDDLKECRNRIVNTWKKGKASGLLPRLEDRNFILLSEIFSPFDATCRCSVCPAAKTSNQPNLHSDIHMKFCGVNQQCQRKKSQISFTMTPVL